MSGIRQVRGRIGENIRVFRKASGMSQELLAEKADLHPVYISQVERGEKAVSVEALWKISKALRTSIAHLFQDV
jgi:XRE family transcriptional regulator, regulator of sulfur utilization